MVGSKEWKLFPNPNSPKGYNIYNFRLVSFTIDGVGYVSIVGTEEEANNKFFDYIKRYSNITNTGAGTVLALEVELFKTNGKGQTEYKYIRLKEFNNKHTINDYKEK